MWRDYIQYKTDIRATAKSEPEKIGFYLMKKK